MSQVINVSVCLCVMSGLDLDTTQINNLFCVCIKHKVNWRQLMYVLASKGSKFF